MPLADADIKAALASTLGLADVTKLAPRWTEIVTWANSSALAFIRQALAELGYPRATADGWDDFNVFQEAIALYWCGIRGRALVTKDQANALNALDWRKQLTELETIQVAGVLVAPVPLVTRSRHGVLTVPTTNAHNPLLYDPRWPTVRNLNP